jgi:coproporphyrinogen III oxidase
LSSATTRVTPIGAPEIDAARDYFTSLHTRLSDAWAELDPASPQRRDEWTRPAGDLLSGNGRLSLIELGAIFDRAGVAFSDVSGAKLPAAASERHTELAGQPFRAMGTSVVVHPVNPYAPTSHANVRLFTARGGEVWWFGGGFDLTPVYPFDEDARAWHEAARAACEPAGPLAYPLLKQACDKYFFLPHRGETRGVGGLFADDLNDAHADLGGDFEHCFALIRRIADTYLDTYVRIVPRSIALTFFFFFFGWIVCHSVTMLFGEALSEMVPHVVWGSVLFVVGIFVSLILSNFVAVPVAPFFREQAAPRKRDLVGTIVEVRTGRVDRQFGNAEADNRGAGLLVEVRCEPGKLKRGDRALVVHYDAKLDAYEIQPLDEAMR